MAWYNNEGKDSDVIVSSRVRIARNIADYPFEPRLTDESAKEIIERVAETLGYTYKRIDFTALTPVEAYAYAEKNLVSPDFAAKKTPHTLFFNEDDGVAVMVCEEDHIRVQCIYPATTSIKHSRTLMRWRKSLMSGLI